MKKDSLLGIDIGTSSCKVALFDSEGRELLAATADYPVSRPRDGWAEQHPDLWWNAAASCLRDITREANGKYNIAAIGVDGISWACVMLSGGQPLAPSPLWFDNRALKECDEIQAKAGDLFELCGNPTKPVYALPKLLWFKNNHPEIYNATDVVLQCNSYIVYRLTGTITQDISQGYGYQFFDARRGAWDKNTMRDLGVNPSIIPAIMPCDAIAGHVSTEASKATGLPEGIPVVAGGLDAACGTLGAGVIHGGMTQEQSGTSGGMTICLSEYKAHPKLIFGWHVVPNMTLLQGGTVGGGGALKWLRDTLCPELSFDEMCGLAAAVNPGSDSLVFTPYLAGERSPLWDANAKGTLHGLDYNKTRGHIIRATLEGVAYSLLHNIETAAEVGAVPTMLRATGGGNASKLWTQIKADVTGLPIETPAGKAAAALGSAILAGVAVGFFASYDEAAAKCVRVARREEPNESLRDIYMTGYNIYRGLYK